MCPLSRRVTLHCRHPFKVRHVPRIELTRAKDYPRGHNPERRSAVRYPLAAATIFNWHTADLQEHQGAAFTRDISTSGIYILCDRERPPANSPVQIQVDLVVAENPAPATRLRLTATGLVVRHGDPPLEECGFAVDAQLAGNT